MTGHPPILANEQSERLRGNHGRWSVGYRCGLHHSGAEVGLLVKDPDFRVAVATSDPIAQWQSQCVAGLAEVEGLTIARWIRSTSRVPVAGRSGTVPSGLRTADVTFALNGRLLLPDTDDSVDLLVDLTTSGLDGSLSLASETWRFGFGGDLSRNLPRVVLQQYALDRRVLRVALIREPEGSIIREGTLRPGSWWHGEELQRVLLTPAGWVTEAAQLRVAALPSRNGSIAPRDQSAPLKPGPVGRRARSAKLPSAALKLAAAGRLIMTSTDALTRHDEWHIGIVDAPIESFLTSQNPPLATWLPLAPGHFAADPFGIERDGQMHIFYEDFDQARERGSIHHVAVRADGSYSVPQLVLDPGVHASYPFLIEHDEGIFMLPEVAAGGELVLYEATEFPATWRRAATLLSEIPAVDASIMHFGDRWWMFAGRLDRGTNHDLFVWHAKDLFGPWIPHADNPVKMDARSSRPGGTPFVVDGVLYRPSQDGSQRYGAQLVINRVTELTPTIYREEIVKVINPFRQFPDGLHTLSQVGHRTLIDGNRRRFVRAAFRNTIDRYQRGVRRRLWSS